MYRKNSTAQIVVWKSEKHQFTCYKANIQRTPGYGGIVCVCMCVLACESVHVYGSLRDVEYVDPSI